MVFSSSRMSHLIFLIDCQFLVPEKMTVTEVLIQEIYIPLISVPEFRSWSAHVAETDALSAEEIASAISFSTEGFPGSFERSSSILGRLNSNWRRWEDNERLLNYMDRLTQVEAGQAHERFVSEVATKPLHFVVVGDLDLIQEDIEALGYPVILRDDDGQIIEENQEE